MGFTQRRGPGPDQIAKWKAEIASQAKARRNQRGRRMRDADHVTIAGPGMLRKTVRTGEADGRHGSGGDHPGPPPAA